MAETISGSPKKRPSKLRRKPAFCRTLSPVNAPDNLPLPDLYLIDSRSLLAEVTRIRHLTLSVPISAENMAATQSVIDALWRLERDMQEILKVQAQIQSAFVQKADALAKTNEPVHMGLRVIS